MGVLDPLKDEIRRSYDRGAWLYDAMMAPIEHFSLRRLRRTLLSMAKGRILEIAAGTGSNIPFYPTTTDLTAIDLSPAMLAIAAGKARKAGLQATLMIMDAEALTFPDGSFDTVVSTMSLCTLPRPVTAVREMLRVCRPGGRLLFLEHGRSGVKWIAKGQDLLSHDPAHAWNRDPARLIQEAGGELLLVRHYGWEIVHLIVARPASN